MYIYFCYNLKSTQGGTMSEAYTAMLAEMVIRNKKIYLLRKKDGLSYAKIGKQFGITSQRVRIICMTLATQNMEETNESN